MQNKGLSESGALAVGGVGVLLVALGVAILQDRWRIGTALASYYAFLGLLFRGRRRFVRELDRRATTRKFFGCALILIGAVWFVFGTVAAVT